MRTLIVWILVSGFVFAWMFVFLFVWFVSVVLFPRVVPEMCPRTSGRDNLLVILLFFRNFAPRRRLKYYFSYSTRFINLPTRFCGFPCLAQPCGIALTIDRMGGLNMHYITMECSWYGNFEHLDTLLFGINKISSAQSPLQRV